MSEASKVTRDPRSTEVNMRGHQPKVCGEAIHDLTWTQFSLDSLFDKTNDRHLSYLIWHFDKSKAAYKLKIKDVEAEGKLFKQGHLLQPDSLFIEANLISPSWEFYDGRPLFDLH